MIQKSIKMTEKGTFTLPVYVRQALGVTKSGDKLMLRYHEKSKIVEITKAPDFLAIQTEIAKLIPKDLPPFDLQKIRTERRKGRYEL